jgi:hypothetical protein
MDGKSEELRLLAEIARWTRVSALPVVRPRVVQILDSDPKKRVYEAIAQGTQSILAVEKSTGANHADISKWLRAWVAEGIVEADSKLPKALFTLDELGISHAPARIVRARKQTTQ